MSRTSSIIMCVFAVLLFCSLVSATSLSLDPINGALSGAPGDTVGWGFTLTNDTDYLVVTGSDFCVGIIASPCSNALGTYSDFIGPSFVVVGPSPESSPVIQSFDPSTMTGLGSFLISSSALSGQSLSGEIVVTYDLYSVDPNDPAFDPIVDTISSGNQITADASVTVAGTAAVPEPSAVLLLCVGLFAAVPVFSRSRRLDACA